MDSEVPLPLQKIFLPRQRKNNGVQKGLVTSQKTQEKEKQVCK
jgi:hypothetical protein